MEGHPFPIAGLDAGRARVLVVDDDPSFGDVTATHLRRALDDTEVIVEPDAGAGLEAIDSADVHCVVSDYDMPGRNGIEFLEAVRERDPALPFVLVTGKGDEAVAGRAISAGVSDYFRKRAGDDVFDVLTNRVRNLVAKYHAERRLDRSLRALESARDGIAIVGGDGSYLYANESFADVHDRSRGDLLGEPWSAFHPDEELERFREQVLPRLEAEGQWSGTAVATDADGASISQRLALTHLDDGAHVRIARDRSEQRTFARAFFQERQIVSFAVDSISDLFYVFDEDRAFVRWNDRLNEVTGYDDAEIEAMGPAEFFAGEDAERVTAAIDRIAETGEEVTIRAQLVTADGERLPYEFTGSRLETDGEFAGVCGIGRRLDGTDRD